MFHRRLQLETLEARTTPAVLLADSFASLAFDPANWDTATLANIAPPSTATPTSLAARFNGNTSGGDELRSVVFPIAGATSATLSYSFERTGTGSRPAAGEDLVIELRTSGVDWTEIARHVADEPDMQAMAKRTIVVSLPAGATSVQLRIRHLGTRGQLGDYWLDDISLTTGNGEVSGRLWFDRNENVAVDATEPVLAGWNVFADANRNGTRDADEPTATTDQEGRYTLTNVPPGNHAIRPELPAGWYATGPERGHVELADTLRADEAAGLSGARVVVASGDGRFLYAAGSAGGSMIVAERAASGELALVQTLTSVDTGGQAFSGIEGIALSPDGRSVYAVSGSADAIAVFDRDAASGTLTWRNTILASGLAAPLSFPAAIVASPDGRQVYVGASNSASVVTFDRDMTTGALTYSSTLTRPEAGLAGISALAINPDGRNLYVTASGDRSLVTLSRNPSSGVLSHLDTLLDNTARANGLDGASAVAVSADGRHVVVAGGFDDSLAVYARDAATGRLEFRDLIRIGSNGGAALDGPQSLAFSADGATLFVAAINSDAIHVLRRDAVTGGLAPVSTVGGTAGSLSELDGVRSIVLMPDGGLIAAAQQSSTLTSFVANAGQANIVLGNAERLSAIDFGVSRDAARWSAAGGDTFWSTAANWHGNMPPLDGEAVAIGDATSTAIISVNDLSDEVSIAGLMLRGEGVNLSGIPLRFTSTTSEATTIAATGGPHVVHNEVQFDADATIQLGDGSAGASGEVVLNGAITGSALSIAGNGRAQLGGTVTLSGAISVASGMLQADGTLAVAGVAVSPLATLAGQGLVASPVSLAATAVLSPGTTSSVNTTSGASGDAASNSATIASVGTLAAGDLNLSAEATLAIDIVAEEVVANHDAVAVSGTVSIEGATITFDLSGRLPIDVEFVLIDNDGDEPVVGQFAGVAEGTYFELEGQRFRLSYTGGDGNDVTIYAPPTGEVLGRVWNDMNSNRVLDATEVLLANWTVFADVNGNGQLDALEPTAISDEQGNYHLERVPVGRTKILPLLTNGWKATTPAPLTDFVNHVETISTGVAGQAPHLDGVRGLAMSPDGRHIYAVSNNDDALVTLRRDTFTGRMTLAGELRDGVGNVNGLNGARAVAASHDGKHVYVAGYSDDAVAVFSRNPVSGELTFVEAKLDNTVGADGLDGANAILVSPDDRHVYVAGYLDDAVAVFSRDADTGKLTYAGRVRDGISETNGLDGASGLAISPDGKHVYVTGANDNAVAVFRREIATGSLTFAAAWFDGQNGITTLGVARSAAVSPDGRFVFVASELDNAVTTFRRDASTGLLTIAATARNGVNGAAGLAGAAAVMVSPDGERIYLASSGDDALVVFDLDRQTGALAYREHLASPATAGLDGAAAIVLSPDGDQIYTAGQNSDAIAMATRVLPPDVVVLSPGEVVTGIDHGTINPPPQVVAIAARSSGWSSAFLSQFNTGAQLVAGLTLAPDGVTFTAHGRIDQFAVRFSEAVTPTLDDLVVFGVTQAFYRPALVSYDAATFTAVWQLPQPIDADKLLVRVSGTIRDASGAMIGSDVVRRLDVLASSSDGTTVQPADWSRVLAALFSRFGSTDYNFASDINGDGLVNYVDAILARNLLGTSLPQGDPTIIVLPPPIAHAPPPALVVKATATITAIPQAAPPPLVVAVGSRPASAQAVVAAVSRAKPTPDVAIALKRFTTRSVALDRAIYDELATSNDLATIDIIARPLRRPLLCRALS